MLPAVCRLPPATEAGWGWGCGEVQRQKGSTLAIPCQSPPPSPCSSGLQAMNAAEAHEMLRASLQHPHLVAQLVPSPITLPWDAAVQDILRSGRWVGAWVGGTAKREEGGGAGSVA